MFYRKNYQNYFYLIISQYLNGMLIFQQILFQNILKAEQIVLRMFVSKSDIFTVFVLQCLEITENKSHSHNGSGFLGRVYLRIHRHMILLKDSENSLHESKPLLAKSPVLID